MASAHLVLDACDFCRNTTAAAAALLSQAPFHSVWPSADGPVPSGSAAGMQPNHALLADPLLIAPAAPPDDADPALCGFLGGTLLTPDETHMNTTTALLEARPGDDLFDESNSTSRRLPIGTALSSDRCRKRITELTTAIKEDEDHYRRLLGEIADIKRGKLDAVLTGKVASADREANCQSIVSKPPVATCRAGAVPSAAEDDNGSRSPQSETGSDEAVGADELCDGRIEVEGTRPTTPTSGASPQFPVPVVAQDDFDGQAGILPGTEFAVQAAANGRVEPQRVAIKRPRGRPPLKRPLRQCAERSAYSASRGHFRKSTYARRASSFGAATRKTARRHNEAVDIAQNLSPKASEESRLEPQRQSYAAQAANPPALNLEVDADVTVAPSEDAGGGCGDDQIGPGTKRDMGSAVMEPSVVVTRDVLGNGPDASESAENHDSAAFLTASAPCPHVVAAEDQEHGNGVDGAPIQLKRLSDGGKSTSPASKKVRDSGLGAPCSFATLPLCHDTAAPPRIPAAVSASGGGEPRAGRSDSPAEPPAPAPPQATARPRQRASRLSLTRPSLRSGARASARPSSSSSSGLGGGPSRPLLPDLQPSQQWRDGLGEVWNAIASRPEAAPFLLPLKKRENLAYFRCVRRPMCLKDVKRKLDGMQISTVSEFRRDVLLVCANAIMFDPDCREARKLFDFAEKSLSPPDGSTVARRSESPSSSYSIAEAAAAVPPDKRLTLLPSWRATAPLRPNGGVGTAA